MIKQTLKNSVIVGFFLTIALFTVLISCTENQQQTSPPPPSSVDFFELRPSTAFVEKKYPGLIEGEVNVDIKPQVSGYLEQIYVNEGDYVQKGQSLFRIKGEVFQEQVNNNQAALSAALASLQTAQVEVERIKPLVEGNVVSDFQLKTAEANYATANARLAQARALLGSSKINAAFTLLKAPVSGYIGRIPNRKGNLVTPADAMPLTTLSEINQVFVYFSLSEAEFIAFLKESKSDQGLHTVELVLADGSVYTQNGQVVSASGNVDRTTGSVPLKAVFSNPDRLLRSGGTAKVILKRTHPAVLQVPIASVRDIQDKYFVFTLADSNKIAMKPIEIAAKAGNQYIVKSGLKAGERVALNHIDLLKEGVSVKPGFTADSTRLSALGSK